MNKTSSIFAVILLVLLSSASQTLAAERWWERAIKAISGANETSDEGGVDRGEVADAFKQALSIGADEVVSRLGVADGFNADPNIHIPLPGELDRAKSMLAAVGMSSVFDDLELRLNRAAETATPIARDLFLQSIAEMSFEDVMEIYRGSDDSATRYFKEKMSPSLSDRMHPIVEDSLSQVGAVQVFEQVLGRYEAIPFAPDFNLDLTDYVVDRGMDGIFYYLAQEEAAIREDPVRQTTQLLKKVFGANQ